MTVPEHDTSNRWFDRDAAEKLLDVARDPIDTMPTGSFESSNVHSALYDFGTRELYVRYLRDGSDAIYRYDDVDASTWQSLVAAGSKGSYINANIAFDYRYTQVNASDLPDEGRGVADDRVRRFLTTP